ncbi:sulfiredoxin NDAI_0C00330 [Naumovozyma dairenensis CBS 421]|uniref:Sulfiredoxin n=1 Tax=Naumovozyma dairenensis (strain ATCC 10597 / BCRC 20456 / CBS 421 / NBRC 0211 / NRRL Y-12639) TaxID=1071378 RepID=G0W7D3_NAUDC|nr:hypothetical protein NDAI_0C00330 [Naumovozyma dairenensis CBS 421]CCD23694.1 hypothetical protein NDAI_0C00330 [Naumovozyma dairenensis CBS 421]
MSSIQTHNLQRITEIPLSQIRRPIMPVLDTQKIDAMVSTMNGIPMASKTCSLESAQSMDGKLPPIDVMVVRHNDENYYFAFGGCHRFQAYDRQAKDKDDSNYLVRCKLIPATERQLKMYVGGSIDNMFN